MALTWLFISASHFPISAPVDASALLRVPPCQYLCISAPSEITTGFSPATATDTVINRPVDKWFAEDKLAHFCVGIALTGSAFHIIRCRLNQSDSRASAFSAGFTFGCGLGKEIWDSTRPRNFFSYKDLMCDMLGIVAGYLLFVHRFH